MKIKTKITEMLGIDLPIIGAPMFLVSYPDLVSAVSNAGGIGCFPSVNYRSLDALREAIVQIRSMTTRPIGVNIILYKEHNPNWTKQLQICLEAGVELIITSMGTPRSIVGEVRSAGSKVFCDVTTLRQARVLAKSGADALIAVAQGAGGHAGTISPFSLIPYLKDETGLPIIAAGSIGTGRQMAAAFSLGAEAVYIGTRFNATIESRASDDYKKMMIESSPEEIEYTDRISGIPANWLKRSLDRVSVSQTGNGVPIPEESFKRWRDIWSAGHGIAQIKEILPAGDIIRNIIGEYRSVRPNLPVVENGD